MGCKIKDEILRSKIKEPKRAIGQTIAFLVYTKLAINHHLAIQDPKSNWYIKSGLDNCRELQSQPLAID